MEAVQHKTINRSATLQKPAATSPKGVQRKVVSERSSAQIQPSLKVSSPQDPAEKEADATAKKIMRMSVSEGSSAAHRQTSGGGLFRQVKQEEKDKKIQTQLRSPYITRFANSGIFTQRQPGVTLQSKGAESPQVTPTVAADIQSSKATGSPLPLSLRRDMEPRFRADFSPVKIHTGDKAANLSNQLNAQAFTTGNHIFFGKGKFQPNSAEGKELIAHELTHTVQQGAAIQRSEEKGSSALNANLLQRASDSGKRMFRTSEGKLVELPPNITEAEATKLETEAKAAEKKLGKGPLPKPVPDVKKLVKLADKKAKPQPLVTGKRVGKVTGKAVPKAGVTAAAMLKAVGSRKVAQYLAAKGTPVLLKGITNLSKLKQNEQTHDSAAEKLNQSEKAVVIPLSEGQSKSSTGQVNALSTKPTPAPDENKAKQKLQESLKANIPQSIEDVDNFKRDKKAQHMGADVMMVVQGDKNAVTATFGEMEQTPPPAPPEHTPETLPPEEIAPPTANLNLGQGAIAPLQQEHTDVSNYTKEADSKLTEEGVSQEQLDMVDSGDLAEANKEKKGMAKAAKTEPLAVQKFAQQETEKVDQDLKQEEKQQRDGLKAKRKAGLNATAQKQKGAKSALEKKREEVAAKINGIYTKAQNSVKKKLADLETQSMKRFDDGNAKATQEFEGNVNREIDAFKDDRYSGFFGWARKAKDWLLGMDDLPQVKAIFDRNRTAFVNTINKLVETISADNKRVIQECKDELANAKNEIKEYVDKLGPDLKDIGKQAAEEMNSKLAEMDQFIAQKEEDLQNKLKDKQTAAIKTIDEKIEKMKEAMSGALAKLGKLLLLAAKKFFTWALQKFGYSLSDIEGIINKGASVLKAIFTQPIPFVKNLINAAINGFKNFGKNILKHLKNALFEWLTGSLQGLVLPQTWDFKGIISVALQMIGIAYQNIRQHLVAVMGEPVVVNLEKTFTLVKTLITEGPMAAWEQLKEMAGEMQEAFIDAVKDFIKTKIIEQAIQWVVSIFVPGAGIVKAIIGIYDTIVFFIQKAKQIAQMIGSFLGSIGEIAAGNIGAAADALESGLARGLTLVISFLAQLLHLSGITNKIKDAIAKIRSKVDAVLLKVAKWIAEKAKKIWGGVKSAAGKVAQWWKGKKAFTNKAGESHTLSFSGEKANAKLMISTTTMPLPKYLKQKEKENKDQPDILAKIKIAEGIFNQKNSIVFKAGRTPEEEKQQQENVMAALTEISQALLDLGGGDFKPDDYPQPSIIPDKKVPPKKSSAMYLSLKTKPKGSETSGHMGTHGWDYIIKKELTSLKGDKWLQMHLISEQLGGEAVPGNLIPATNGVNSAWRSGIEGRTSSLIAKTAGGANTPTNMVWITTTVSYFGEKLDGFQFASGVKTEVGLYAYKGKKNNKAVFEAVASPVFSMSAQIMWPELALGNKASLNKSSGSHLRVRAGVDAAITNDIKRNRPYKHFKDFETKMELSLVRKFPNPTHPEHRAQLKAIKAVRNKPNIVDPNLD